MARWWSRKSKVEAKRWDNADLVWQEQFVPPIKAAAEERKRLVAGHEDIVAFVEALLFEEDPIGINFEENVDEYRPEAESITIRLREATSRGELRRMVHEEFVRWFDPKTAGPEERYERIGNAIWDAHGPRPELNP